MFGIIVTIIGTLGALIIAAIGLRTWRRQLKGTAEYEVARRAVLLSYRVRDAIQAVRRPMLSLRKEEVEAGRELQEEQRIYADRIDRLLERSAELRILTLEAKVIWGVEAEQCFEPLRQLIIDIQSQVWEHFWLKGAYATPGATVDNNPERVAANNRVVYFVSEDDEFSQSINDAVRHVEIFFQRHIRG